MAELCGKLLGCGLVLKNIQTISYCIGGSGDETTSIVPSVTKIFNLSLTTGRSLWLGNLPELHPSLKVTSKLFQIDRFQSSQSQVNFWKDMHNLLSHHLHTNCPLSLYHWGFTEGKSTTSTLLSFIHDCHNSSQEVCIVFFDPFDTVSHLPLLYKLSSSKSPIFC